jgi:uncharacterized protein YqgC (DUF456 family)
MNVLIVVLGVVLAAAGLVGLLLPGIPGMPLVLAGIVVAAWADDFARIGFPTLAAVTVLAVIGMILDYMAGVLGARRWGASRWGFVGALVGLVAGLPLGLAGLVIGPAAGAVVFEYARDRDIHRAARAGVGVLVGFVLGTAFKYAVAMTMIGLAVLAYSW